MRQKVDLSGVFALISMLGLLALGFGLDHLILAVKEYVSIHFKGVLLMLVLYPIATILVLLAAFLLFWVLVSRMKKNYLISTAFIIIGIFVSLLIFSNIKPLGFSLLWLQPFVLPSGNMFIAAASILVIGVLNLILHHSIETKE
jgi:uncharacterized membrane protein